MDEDVIEYYNTFNTKGCPDKLIVGNFNDQPIPSNYYNFLNDDNDDENNIPGNLVDDALPDNKVVKDAIVSTDEEINYNTIIGDYDSLSSDIDPLQNERL